MMCADQLCNGLDFSPVKFYQVGDTVRTNIDQVLAALPDEIIGNKFAKVMAGHGSVRETPAGFSAKKRHGIQEKSTTPKASGSGMQPQRIASSSSLHKKRPPGEGQPEEESIDNVELPHEFNRLIVFSWDPDYEDKFYVSTLCSF